MEFSCHVKMSKNVFLCMIIDHRSAVRTQYTVQALHDCKLLARILFYSWKKDNSNLVMTARIPKDDLKKPKSITCIVRNMTVKIPTLLCILVIQVANFFVIFRLYEVVKIKFDVNYHINAWEH